MFYLLVVPLGVITAAFLRVRQSTATWTGKVLGGTLYISGPIVVVALVVIGGYVFIPKAASFPFTVYVRGETGPQDIVLRNRGKVFLKLDSEISSESIGENGQAVFPRIPANFWPGSAASSNLLIERIDGALIKDALYGDIVSLDFKRKRVRIPAPGELFAIGTPGVASEKTYQLCLKIGTEDEKRAYCFVSKSAVCIVGRYCKEGSDEGASIRQLANDIKGHLHH